MGFRLHCSIDKGWGFGGNLLPSFLAQVDRSMVRDCVSSFVLAILQT